MERDACNTPTTIGLTGQISVKRGQAVTRIETPFTITKVTFRCTAAVSFIDEARRWTELMSYIVAMTDGPGLGSLAARCTK